MIVDVMNIRAFKVSLCKTDECRAKSTEKPFPFLLASMSVGPSKYRSVHIMPRNSLVGRSKIFYHDMLTNRVNIHSISGPGKGNRAAEGRYLKTGTEEYDFLSNRSERHRKLSSFFVLISVSEFG